MRTAIIMGCLPFISLVIAKPLPLPLHHELAARQAANDTSEVISSTSSAPASTTTTSLQPTRSSSVTTTTTTIAQTTTQAITTTSAPVDVSSSTTTIVSTSDPVSSAVATTTSVSQTQTGVPTLSGMTSSNNPFSTSSSSSLAAITTTQSIATLVTTISRSLTTSSSSSLTASPSASSSAAAQQSASSGGLSKGAIIGIAVAASIVGVVIIAWTLFRKWKLRPSSRFNRKLDAFDFGNTQGPNDDDFFEKTLNRSTSQTSAERQRKALVAEEFDGPASTHVAGVPEHDFTAAGNYQNDGYGMYNADPFAHSAAYDYTQDASYHGSAGYPPQSYDQYGNPIPLTSSNAYDYPTQDQPHDVQGVYGHGGGTGSGGYADLKRGNSNGSSGHGHGHGHAITTGSQDHGYGHVTQAYEQGQDQQAYGNQAYTMTEQDAYSQQPRVQPGDFPDASQYLGRPTGGAEGPYAQASTYRY